MTDLNSPDTFAQSVMKRLMTYSEVRGYGSDGRLIGQDVRSRAPARTRPVVPPIPKRTPPPARSALDRDPIREPRSIEAPRTARGRTPWNLSDIRGYSMEPEKLGRELRSRALTAMERMPAASDATRAAATAMLEQQDTPDGWLSRYCLALSDPIYLRAWSKLAEDPVSGRLLLSRSEAEMLFTTVPRLVSRELRAMSLDDAAGGYLVPLQLDPVLTIRANGSFNQIRSVARQVVATGSVWRGPATPGASWSYDSDASETSDDSPSVDLVQIPICTARGWVEITEELLRDAANATEQIADVLSFGKDQLEATAFAVGSGSGQPTGIVTALAGGTSTVTATTADTLAAADIYALLNALPGRYSASPNAAWLGAKALLSKVRQLDSGAGARLWKTQAAGQPPLLLELPALVADPMDSTLDSGQNNDVLVVGDFSNYVICDRLGVVVDFVPWVPGANQRPSGKRGWLATARHGADSVNDGAFRLLRA